MYERDEAELDEKESERDKFKLQQLEETIKQELEFCSKVNSKFTNNYHMWYYRMKLATEVLVPLTKKSPCFKENLLLKEISGTQAYVSKNKADQSAKHYFERIKTSFQNR